MGGIAGLTPQSGGGFCRASRQASDGSLNTVTLALVPKSRKPVAFPPTPLTAAQWKAVTEQLRLSPQQAAIVALVVRGKQEKEIAAELGLSRPTIRTYLQRIFERAAVNSRLELVIQVFTICLIVR